MTIWRLDKRDLQPPVMICRPSGPKQVCCGKREQRPEARALTRRRQTERLIALMRQVQAAQALLTSALQAMDYQQALALQIEIDGFECEARRMNHRGGHASFRAPRPPLVGIPVPNRRNAGVDGKRYSANGATPRGRSPVIGLSGRSEGERAFLSDRRNTYSPAKGHFWR
jgi:hypothetical protein